MENTFSREFMMKPSECNAQRELPLTLLVAQIIDLATDHANHLGIGFLALEPCGLGWVLSRLSVEMRRWPKNGEKYVLSTWIESYNSHFSERNFSVVADSGEELGFIRTIWTIIDLESHKGAGTANTVLSEGMIAGRDCPIPKYAKSRPFEPQYSTEYKFKYCDLDFYRHVNTVRYISILLNQFTLEDFDTHILSRFDIGFAHEAKYGETALISSIDEDTATPALLGSAFPGLSTRRSFAVSIDSNPILSAAIVLTPKETM